MCNASHIPEIVLLRVFFTTWIQKHLDTLQTVTYMAKNYIYVFETVKPKAIPFLHYFILLNDVLMTKTKQIYS